MAEIVADNELVAGVLTEKYILAESFPERKWTRLWQTLWRKRRL